MKVIAIMGEPGSGKTTPVREVMKELNINNNINTTFKLVPYHQEGNIYLLGKYEEGNIYGECS